MADSDCIIVHEQVVVPDAVVEEMVALPGEKGDKGDPFTYDDFTPEQIAELQRPATEAAAVANQAAEKANKAVTDIKVLGVTLTAEEAKRESAESSRTSAESERAEAESSGIEYAVQHAVTEHTVLTCLPVVAHFATTTGLVLVDELKLLRLGIDWAPVLVLKSNGKLNILPRVFLFVLFVTHRCHRIMR